MSGLIWAAAGLVLYLVSVLIRLWPRHGLRHHGVDSWFHLHSARIIRRTRRLPRVVPEYLVGGEWDYPPLFPALLAFIPESTLMQGERFLAPLTDGLLPVVAFSAAGLLTHSLWLALGAGALVALNPLSVTQALTLTPRPAGALLLTVTLMGAITYQNTRDLSWALPVALGSTLVLLTHRMSSQTLLFLSIGLAIALLSPLFLLIPVIGGVLAWVASGGFYRRVLRGHLGELAFWRTHIHERDEDRPLRLLGISASNLRASDGQVRQLVGGLRLPFVVSPVLLPALLFPLAVRAHLWPPFTRELWIWCVLGLGLCLATTLVPTLQFLGQGTRYLSYTVVPAGVLAAVALAHDGFRVLSAALCLPALVMIFWVVRTHQADPDAGTQLLAELESVAQRLRGCRGARVLCIPVALASPIAYLSEVAVLRHGGQAGLERFSFFVPMVKRPLSEIAETYRLSHVVCDTRIASAKDLSLPGSRTILSGGRLELAELMNEDTDLQVGTIPVAVGEGQGT
jgi:hypothetical protein